MELSRKLFRFSVDAMSMITLVAMVTLVFANVVLRYVFDSGLAWSEEVSRITFVWLVFLGIVIAYQENEHLAVDILASRLKGRAAKVVGFIRILVSVLILLACAIGGVKLMVLTQNQGLPSTGLPTSIIYLAGVISCVACSLILVFVRKRNNQEGESA
ncbi:TRAP transporter small permease [Vibrio penaeicida]|uniref:TRAP transporter small permease n=1 Tax=Vibrio penaeicida TaxID=104609 RepID=UPI000CE9E38B|nr:TRAP transporter small permease [Vibrio penaeicida]